LRKLFNKNNLLLMAVIVMMAFLLSGGVNQIYHQDEYRWVVIADETNDVATDVQPPMYLFLLNITGRLFGYEQLRILTAFIAILNLLLVYFVSKKTSANKSIALLAGFLFAFNAYSLIAGLQIDIDGALMPFFVLTSYYAYLKLGDNRKLWIPVLALSLIGGFLSKLSFIIFFGALIVDYYFTYKEEHGFRFKKLLLLAGGGVVLFGVLAGAFYISNPDRFQNVLTYASGRAFNGVDIASRAYLDLAFKVLKSFVLLSPLLLLPIFYTLFKPDLRHKYRFWLTYLFFSFIFYTVIFDFSTLTIEKYFTFMIVPAAIIGADVLYPFFAGLKNKKDYLPFVISSVAVLVLSCLILSLNHDVLPLNPKIAYFQHLKSFNLAFLIPFTGGSGPIGFYFSAAFIFAFWLLIFLAFIGYFIWYQRRGRMFLAIIVSAGLIYNAFFITEFLRGKLYGSVPKIARETVDYVNNAPEIGEKQVITYYDIAPYDLRKFGKYHSRFYTALNRDYSAKITSFRGYYMIVNFPEVGNDNQYWKLIERCSTKKEFRDKKIRSYVFDCTKLK